ncbi:glycosyltransferase family 4 protein [Caldalkalibacillus mannanilyticus]|uniref:glycosyltransferase family 4 protein n=1 Tax=Caldalkalibacillus mannanilyticus TaxID=1418 RepID=UPI00046889DD|nr:glycosyltransferase family 4 protein [Caldalkalibacillus mannanilyticus]
MNVTIAIISPGKYSVPPVIGTSVEHDIDMVAKAMSPNHKVVIFTRKTKEYPHSTEHQHLIYKRVDYQNPKQYLRSVIKHLENLKPDVIQVENRPKYIQDIRQKFPRTPIILSMHSIQYASPPSISKRELKHHLQQADALITNSHYLKEKYNKHLPFLKKKSHGVHLGIDGTPYEKAKQSTSELAKLRAKYRLSKNTQLLLFVGRLKKEKGVHHAIAAFRKLLPYVPDFKLMIVGSSYYGKNTQTKYVQQLKKQSLSIRDKVIFTQFIRPEKLPYYYQLADIVVTPSVWGEPFCRVNLEAMAAEKPVVTTNRGGIPEVVKNGVNGYVLPIHQLSKKLPKVLFRILQSKELKQKLSTQARNRATSFTWEQTANKYLAIYQSCLKQKSHQGGMNE